MALPSVLVEDSSSFHPKKDDRRICSGNGNCRMRDRCDEDPERTEEHPIPPRSPAYVLPWDPVADPGFLDVISRYPWAILFFGVVSRLSD
jgi:hypothetical protein